MRADPHGKGYPSKSFGICVSKPLWELVIGLCIMPTIQYGVRIYIGEMPRLRVPARKVESFYTLVSECVNPDNQGIS